MVDFSKPSIRMEPSKLIIHVGTNNLVKDEPKQIADKIIQLAKNIKTNNPTGSVAIFSILTRSHDQSSPKHVAQTNKVVK